MKENLLAWSREYIPLYNQLSEKYHVPYYTQSPLSGITDTIDYMFIGINPGGTPGGEITQMAPEEYLAGNPCWEQRFVNGTCDWKYNVGARFFMGFDRYRHQDSIDNDNKVVWTNLSPFVSAKGFSDLQAELRTVGITSLLQLIKLLMPKKIVFMGGNALHLLDKYMPIEEQPHFTHEKVFSNQPFEIGRFYDIPIIYLCHPSQRWSVKGSHYFIPMFVHLHELIDTISDGKPKYSVKQVCELIRKELDVWKEQVSTE